MPDIEKIIQDPDPDANDDQNPDADFSAEPDESDDDTGYLDPDEFPDGDTDGSLTPSISILDEGDGS